MPNRTCSPRRLVATVLLALLPLTAWTAPLEKAVPGTDYALIKDGKPYQPLNGKVEVVEVFAYWCPHCAHFAPALDAWKSTAPKNVRVTYLPLPQDSNDAFARGFFAASDAGALGRTHQALFKAVHEQGTVAKNPSIDELAGWYSGQTLDSKRITAAMNAPAMAPRLQRARQFAMDSGLEGTPTLIVNGKYRILGGTPEQQLHNVDKLVAELSAGSR